MPSHILKETYFDSPLGLMVIIADEKALYLLEFVERKRLEHELHQLHKIEHLAVSAGRTQITEQLEKELDLYFEGQLTEFKTPLHYFGTDFQKKAWKALQKIPYGKTRSYQEQAVAIGQPTACRAVANANAKNPISIVIPCHRIIQSNGTLGGYGGGVERKQWLLDHEQKYASMSVQAA